MHCPACRAENKDAEGHCQACGAALMRSRPGRGRSKAVAHGPLSPETEARNRAALRAYRLSVLALVPGLGLVLGPLAVLLGAVVRRRSVSDPHFTARGPVNAAIVFGAVVTLTNWIGFGLMYLGLHRAGVL
jgi:hypothetical protein